MKAGRCILALFVFLLPRFDNEGAVFDAGVFPTGLCVVLLLAVANKAHFVIPLVFIGQSVVIKLVGPDKFPLVVKAYRRATDLFDRAIHLCPQCGMILRIAAVLQEEAAVVDTRVDVHGRRSVGAKSRLKDDLIRANALGSLRACRSEFPFAVFGLYPAVTVTRPTNIACTVAVAKKILHE